MELVCRYDNVADGWVSDAIELTRDIDVSVRLPRNGYVVVKQIADGVERTVLMSDRTNCFSLRLFVHRPEGAGAIIVKLYLSDEPVKIDYGYI